MTTLTDFLRLNKILQENFQFPDFVQIHYNGKQRDNLSTGDKKEWVSVSATGPGIEKDKFLGDTKVDEGTGIQVGTAVSLLVLAWKLGKCGDGLSYYTCTVNTSRDKYFK